MKIIEPLQLGNNKKFTDLKILPDNVTFLDIEPEAPKYVPYFKISELGEYLKKNKIKLLWCFNLNFVGQILKEYYCRKVQDYKKFINFYINPTGNYYRINLIFEGFNSYIFGFNNILKDYKDYKDYKDLIKKITELNSFLKPFNISLISKPETIPLTVGEISKMLLLEFMYHKKKYASNLFTYKILHKYDYDDRAEIYHSGLNLFNEKYKNKIINNIYIYDINSFYPYVMLLAGDLYGNPKDFNGLTAEAMEYIKKSGSVAVYSFNRLIMKLKKNSIPVFKYLDVFRSSFYFSYKPNTFKSVKLFDFEFENLKRFYDIESFEIFHVKAFKRRPYAYNDFINFFYEIKKDENSELIRQFSKLILNNAYGKLGQNPRSFMVEFDTNNISPTQSIRLKKIKAIYNNRNKMSTVNAAYITALGRCELCKRIVEICGPNLARNFIYSDCDSIHTFKKVLNLSNDIGKIKLVEFATRARYLDFKKYLLINDNAQTFSAVISGFSPTREDLINNNKTLNELINNFKPGFILSNLVGIKVANGVEIKKIKKEL